MDEFRFSPTGRYRQQGDPPALGCDPHSSGGPTHRRRGHTPPRDQDRTAAARLRALDARRLAAYADTDLTATVTAPKIDPRDVAIAVVDGIEHGDTEVLVDDVSRHFKQAVAGPVESLSILAATRS